VGLPLARLGWRPPGLSVPLPPFSSPAPQNPDDFHNDSDCQNEIFRMAKQMIKERQDITGLNCIKGASGKVIVDDKGIKD